MKAVIATASESERDHLLHLFHFSKSFTATYNPLLLLILLLAIIWKRLGVRGPRWWRVWGMRQSAWVGVVGLGDNAAVGVVMGYLVLNVFYSFYRATSHILLLGTRLGLISLINLPLLYLLAAKNLPLLPHYVGWSYERINYLHRWCGRGVVLTALGHFVAFQVWECRTKEEGWKFFFMRVFMSRRIFTGVFGLGSYILIGLTSLRHVRNRMYEFFLSTHLLLLLLSLALLSFHEPTRTGLPYTLLSAIIFISDRAARLLRHRHVRQGHLRVLPGRMIVLEVDVSGRRGMWWNAGQHVFLSVKGIGAFHESHPFTIASAPYSDSLKLFIRANAGFTHALLALAHADSNANVDIVLDGAYGHAPCLQKWEDGVRVVVLVAGGSGVAYTIAILEDLANRRCELEGQEGVQKVAFVWAVKDRAHVSWIADALAAIRGKVRREEWLEVRIHCTSHDPSSEATPLLDTDSGPALTELQLQVISGRPDVAAYISSAASDHKEGGTGERSGHGETKLNDLIAIVSGMPDDISHSSLHARCMLKNTNTNTDSTHA
ncbi:hypothetical protein G7K_3798-t1 [Saitoella complicata NRRL Y-17804]|uniref:ferric-chelate reductase (NADPH) n=1 Tax=Saitoella complicata (strain BCRC 22490 / CBS 7301 / JCM 7358 / NBRC 10748 / NRRL Y-17804) TaxID=698492 RepID=A0A0E9NIH6_SAICN|nr:hypothetical protein G7K_3798-t1 [Saitoella complicata NRRL Y-17804]